MPPGRMHAVHVKKTETARRSALVPPLLLSHPLIGKDEAGPLPYHTQVAGPRGTV